MNDKRCKLCDAIVHQTYKLTTSDKLWYHCACGCMFNDHYELPENVFDAKFVEKLKDAKGHEERYKYLARVYAPLIEEKIYGRKLLDVGFGLPILMKEFNERGWVVEGIDVCSNDYIKADFEHYDFWKMGHDRYDLIWLGDVLQCFNDPVKAIYKAYNLLNPNGILFIITPNTDNFRKNRIAGWGHWDLRENRQFINEDILRKIFGKCDESLRGNLRPLYIDPYVTSKRFITFSNMHVMAQKQSIEEYAKPQDIKVLSDAMAK